MPRGGRRPGAGAPKGNFNAVKSGTSSRRMRFALTTLLAVPEYRHLIRFLLASGDNAYRDVTDLLLASARLLYDRPVRDDIRHLAEQAAARYVATVGPVDARKAVRTYHRTLRVDARGRTRIGRDRPETRADPAFSEFARLLLGINIPRPEFADDNQPPAPITPSPPPSPDSKV
jgi:hypothetical protein